MSCRRNVEARTKSHAASVTNDLTRPLFADDLNHDFTAARSRVKLQHRNLLPLTEHQLAATKRDGYGGAEKR